jgi:hypothetical protein
LRDRVGRGRSMAEQWRGRGEVPRTLERGRRCDT